MQSIQNNKSKAFSIKKKKFSAIRRLADKYSDLLNKMDGTQFKSSPICKSSTLNMQLADFQKQWSNKYRLNSMSNSQRKKFISLCEGGYQFNDVKQKQISGQVSKFYTLLGSTLHPGINCSKLVGINLEYDSHFPEDQSEKSFDVKLETNYLFQQKTVKIETRRAVSLELSNRSNIISKIFDSTLKSQSVKRKLKPLIKRSRVAIQVENIDQQLKKIFAKKISFTKFKRFGSSKKII